MIRVPLLSQDGSGEESKQVVEIEQKKLPQNVNQMIAFLSREKAGIEYWLEIAVSLTIDITILVSDSPLNFCSSCTTAKTRYPTSLTF